MVTLASQGEEKSVKPGLIFRMEHDGEIDYMPAIKLRK